MFVSQNPKSLFFFLLLPKVHSHKSSNLSVANRYSLECSTTCIPNRFMAYSVLNPTVVSYVTQFGRTSHCGFSEEKLFMLSKNFHLALRILCVRISQEDVGGRLFYANFNVRRVLVKMWKTF